MPSMQSMPENGLGSLHFSETDFTLGDEASLDRLAVPNPSTVASHSSSAQHQLV